jgi:hypothetical protein
VSWNVDPLPFSVPESLALLPDEGLPLDEEPPLLLDELLQAARDKATATRPTPAVAPARMRTRCISDTPL